MPRVPQVTEFQFWCKLLVVVQDLFPFESDPSIISALESRVAPFGRVKLILKTLSQLNDLVQADQGEMLGLSHRSIIIHQAQAISQCIPGYPARKSSGGAPTTSTKPQAPHSSTSGRQSENFLSADFSPQFRFYPQVFAGMNEPDSFLAINAFFKQFDISDALDLLNRWIGNLNSLKHASTDNLREQLTFYEHVHLLIEAAWIMYKTPDRARRDVSGCANASELVLLNDLLQPKHDGRPSCKRRSRVISVEVFESPHCFLTTFFEYSSLNQWKDELYSLHHYSLGSASALDLQERINISITGDLLQQLIVACYLINIRLSARHFELNNTKVPASEDYNSDT